MAARKRRRPPSLRSALVFACGFAAGGLAGASLKSPRLWLLRLQVPVETVDLAVSSRPDSGDRPAAAGARLASSAGGAELERPAARSAVERRIDALPEDAERPRLAALGDAVRLGARAAAAQPPRAAPSAPRPSLRQTGVPALPPPARPAPNPLRKPLAPTPPRPPAAAAQRPSVSAAQRRVSASERRAAARASPSLAAVPAPPPARARRIVQVVATPHRDRARELVAALRQQGFDAYLERGRKLHTVRVRPKAEPVERTVSRLRRLGHETQVLPE